jgi:hypothetical protein
LQIFPIQEKAKDQQREATTVIRSTAGEKIWVIKIQSSIKEEHVEEEKKYHPSDLITWIDSRRIQVSARNLTPFKVHKREG